MSATVFLLKQLANLSLALWPIGAFLIALSLAGGYINRHFLSNNLTKILYSNFLLLLLAFCILMAGSIWRQPFLTGESAGYQEPSAWAARSVYVLLTVQIGAAAVFIWQAKNYRFFATALAGLSIWLALLSSLLALSAISGVWL